MTAGRRWRRLAVLPVVAGLFTLAACGGTAAGSTATATATAAPDGGGPGPVSEAYVACLAENGVTLPEPGEGGPQGGGADGATPPTGAPPSGATPPSGAPAASEAGGQAGSGGRGAPPGVDEDTWTAAQEACAGVA